MESFKDIYVYYWKTEEITEKNNYYTELRAYGLDTNNENCCIRILDCKTRLIIEFLEEDYLSKNFNSIKRSLSDLIYNKKDLETAKIIKRKKLYGCNIGDDLKPKLFDFLEIYFSSRIAMFSFKKKILNINFGCPFKFHEVNAKTENQFFTTQNLDPCGWISLKKPIPSEEKISKCKHEFTIEKSQIKKSEINIIPDIKIMSWDIEAKCKDISKNQGNHITDCVFQISCIFYSIQTKKYRKVLLTLGKCGNFAQDVEVKIYRKESDLILGFTNIIKEEQPNVLTGWNIFNFDITFMINRATHHKILGEFLCFGFTEESGEIISLKWSSKAFSTTEVKYINAEGILSLDLIEVVRKDHKLDSYSLGNVSKHFLKETKDDITFADLMRAYDAFLKNKDSLEEEFTKVGKYCVQDSVLVVDLFNTLHIWIGFTEMAKTTSTTIMEIHLNGQQKKFFNQVYRYCYRENIIVETDAYRSKETDKYAGAYVFDPIPGLYEYVVPFDFNSLYPSLIIAYNLDYTTIVSEKEAKKLPEHTIEKFEWADHISCDHDPLIKQRKLLTNLIDSCTSKSRKQEFQKQRSNIVKKINKKIMCQDRKFYFLKKEYYGKGVLPTIIQNLLDARKQVRSEMKKIKDPSVLAVLNQRQLSYKICANSMYGATGVKVGSLPFMPIAMCVTYMGRISIQKTARILKEIGGTIVYGDTDSNYVMFKEIQGEHKEKCKEIWEKSEQVAAEISKHFPDPMNIEFESVIYYKFMILTKKRYMYYSCDKEGNISQKIGQKGVLLARRDNSKFVKNIYEKTVMEVFSKKTKEEVLEYILNSIFDFVTKNNFNTDLLKINKSINDYNDCNITYNSETQKYYIGNYIVKEPPKDLTPEQQEEFCIKTLPAQVQLELRQIKRGEEKSEGGRIEYIILDKINATKQSEKIEDYKYFLANKELLRVDTDYYIQRLIDPLEQIFESIYQTQDYITNNLKQFILKTKTTREIKKLFRPKLVVN